MFLLLIFIAELAVGIAGYMKHTDLEASLVKSLNESIKHYDDDALTKKNFDILQIDVSLPNDMSPKKPSVLPSIEVGGIRNL